MSTKAIESQKESQPQSRTMNAFVMRGVGKVGFSASWKKAEWIRQGGPQSGRQQFCKNDLTRLGQYGSRGRERSRGRGSPGYP